MDAVASCILDRLGGPDQQLLNPLLQQWLSPRTRRMVREWLQHRMAIEGYLDRLPIAERILLAVDDPMYQDVVDRSISRMPMSAGDGVAIRLYHGDDACATDVEDVVEVLDLGVRMGADRLRSANDPLAAAWVRAVRRAAQDHLWQDAAFDTCRQFADAEIDGAPIDAVRTVVEHLAPRPKPRDRSR